MDGHGKHVPSKFVGMIGLGFPRGRAALVPRAFFHFRCVAAHRIVLHQSCSFKAVPMLRLALVALIAALAHATTPDNVSSRLMIHVSFVEQVWVRARRICTMVYVGSSFSSQRTYECFLILIKIHCDGPSLVIS